MSDEKSNREPSTEARHLAALRALIRRGSVAVGDVEAVLAETVAMAREALGARGALFALYDGAAEQWSAVDGDGNRLAQSEIGLVASLSILEWVRASGEPILAAERAPLLVRSKSAARHEVRSVLAAPLWLPSEEGEPRRLAGCLYADRRGRDEPFETADIELVLDLARLAERTLPFARRLELSERRLAALRGVTESAYRLGHYESRDPAFVASVLEPLRRAAGAGRVGVLLIGPTGTGKTHLAQAFHYASQRRDGPFVVLDCGALTSAEALGAELFGYAPKSGFSAPAEGRAGKAKLADGGTLFVDEIGALPLELQPRLLRLLQSGRFSPLGSAEELCVDLQVVAAASEDLRSLVERGGFRADLLYRLSEITLHLPPLEARLGDLPGFAETFLAAARDRFARPELEGFTRAALERLRALPWSRAGNLRGLEHAVHRSVLLAPAGILRLDCEHLVLPEGIPAVPARPSAPPVERGEESALGARLAAKLREKRGNLTALAADPEIAALLGLPGSRVPVSTLRLRLRRLGLDEALAAARRSASPDLDALLATLRRRGSASAAAAELGLSRDQLVWRLRQAGWTVRAALAARP